MIYYTVICVFQFLQFTERKHLPSLTILSLSCLLPFNKIKLQVSFLCLIAASVSVCMNSSAAVGRNKA